jgi:hypothetical protein
MGLPGSDCAADFADGVRMKPLTSKEYPSTHLMNPAKDYVHSSRTDIRATFARIRAEQAQQVKQPAKIRRIR